MTSMLNDIAADLRYAATTGITNAARDVVAQGRSRLEVGTALLGVGPGLSQLLAHRIGAPTGHVAAALHALDSVLDEMVNDLTNQGAELVAGRRR